MAHCGYYRSSLPNACISGDVTRNYCKRYFFRTSVRCKVKWLEVELGVGRVVPPVRLAAFWCSGASCSLKSGSIETAIEPQ